MKKKTNNLLTKEYFDKRMLGIDKRFQGMEKSFDAKLSKVRDGIIFYVDERFKRVEETLEKHEKILESISKTLDWLVHKFTKLDEDLTVAGAKYSEIHENLNNHETRIQVLEKKSSYVK